jgi:hypothetical protein
MLTEHHGMHTATPTLSASTPAGHGVFMRRLRWPAARSHWTPSGQWSKVETEAMTTEDELRDAGIRHDQRARAEFYCTLALWLSLSPVVVPAA